MLLLLCSHMRCTELGPVKRTEYEIVPKVRSWSSFLMAMIHACVDFLMACSRTSRWRIGSEKFFIINYNLNPKKSDAIISAIYHQTQILLRNMKFLAVPNRVVVVLVIP